MSIKNISLKQKKVQYQVQKLIPEYMKVVGGPFGIDIVQDMHQTLQKKKSTL